MFGALGEWELSVKVSPFNIFYNKYYCNSNSNLKDYRAIRSCHT